MSKGFALRDLDKKFTPKLDKQVLDAVKACKFIPLILAIFIGAAAISLCSASAVRAEGLPRVEQRLEKMREHRQELVENRHQKQGGVAAKIQEKREDFKQRSASKQAELKGKVVEKIKKVFLRILDRLNTAIKRLDKIADRIASRIDKLKAKGVNTSGAEAALLAAESKGSAAAVAIDNAKSQIDAIDAASSSVPDTVHTARNAVRDAKQALKDYHKSLVETIKLLKAARALREATPGGGATQSAH